MTATHLRMVVQAYNHNAEAGGSWVYSQPQLCSGTCLSSPQKCCFPYPYAVIKKNKQARKNKNKQTTATKTEDLGKAT